LNGLKSNGYRRFAMPFKKHGCKECRQSIVGFTVPLSALVSRNINEFREHRV